MNHSNKNRNCAVGNSNNSSEESFFNDCATCCYEFRQSPPFPNKCIYDDVLQQYKMRLKKAELELTDRELQVAMMKDQRLKMETYCRNNMEETENLKARYVAVLDELENLKKHYEIVNDQKTKQKRASNEAFEALFKAELDKWNEENKKTLNKIELMDFDIQKLIQLLAEKTKAEEGNEMKQHIERIENLVAHQSTILNKLTAKVGENTVALNSSNQGIVDKMKALMEKTESDLLEQIESVQKKTQIISDDSSKLARLHSIENQIIDPDSSNTLQHLPPRNSVDEESIEQKFMQPSEMASPSLKLDAKDDVRISIQIQHVPSLRDVQNSNRKSTDESLPKTGKNSSSEQIKISPVEKWKDYTSQGIQTENNDEMKDLEDIEDKELMLLDEYYKDLCSEAIREPRGFHKPLFTDPEETITVSNCVDLISDNPRVIELTIEKEKRPNEKKKNEETKDTNMKNPREDIRKDVCRTVTTQTEDEIPLNQEECFAARESASSVENVSSELEQTSLLSGFREEDMPDCRKISKSSSDLVKCMVLGFPDNEVFKFADPPCRQQDIVSDFEVLFSKNENQQVEPDSSSGSTLPECCGDFSSTEDAVQKNIGSNMKGPAYFKMSESSSCKGEHDSSEQCCKQHLMKNDYFIPYSEDLDQHLKIEETRVACPFQVEKETQTLPEDYEHSEVDEDEEKNESIIEEKQPRVHLEEEKNTLPGDEIELNSSKLGESQTGSEKQDYQENKIVLPDLYQSIEREIEEEILRELSGSYSDLRIFEEVSMKDVLESPESEEIEVKQITELDSSPTGSFSRRDRKHERVSLDSLYKIKMN
ncbi:hypothetical protein HHI36_012617 [Cryptolaemus montrouzieri]|uniref:Uncharacterized protein n=1 Tax=Cryptolaemus montrouzieri TaxID=559131 RepID=A0ABD2NES1_9CUCU